MPPTHPICFRDTPSHLKQWLLGGSIFLNHFQVLYSWEKKLSGRGRAQLITSEDDTGHTGSEDTSM